MPDRDDMPEHGPDPMDEAYLRAEHVLDDEAARAARRARVLAAVAQAPATPAAPSVRRPVRRYGGWLAAACVAGLSVWTAQRVYRSTPPPQQEALQAAPAAVTPPAPPAPSAALAPDLSTSPSPTARHPAPRARAFAAAPVVAPRPAVAPPADIAPPPPLPIPPVEKPIQAPPPPAPAPVALPAVAAKAGAAEPAPNDTVQSVVVTGSRITRRDYSPSSPAISKPLTETSLVADARSKMLGARLRGDAVAGRVADIEPVLAEGVPVDAADENGVTALMGSIQTGQSEAAALLRRHGASLDLKNRAGVSARDMAAMKNDAALNQALGISPSAATPP